MEIQVLLSTDFSDKMNNTVKVRELFKFLWKTLKFSSFPPSNVEMSIKKEVIPLFKNYKFLMN